jgi:peptide subunit release factor 1 (eRF1)
MITREELRELSQFRLQDGAACAISFYFQPDPPHNKAHLEQLIYAKDLVRDAMREVLNNGKNTGAQADLEKVLSLAEQLHSVSPRAKAAFAYGKANFWREFDLPPDLGKSQLFVGQRFHLKPLAALFGAQPKLGVALVDRQRARLFELRLDELTERNAVFHRLPRHGRSDGYAGYDGGHAERRIAEEALRHYKQVAAKLKEQAEAGVWEKLIIGCHETNWSEFEPFLHSYIRQRLLGRFTADVAAAKGEEVRQHATRIFHQALDRRRHELVHEAVGQARGHARGVTGLRRVLRSLELGEVQTVLVGENYRGQAVECTKCGHLDSHIVRYCSICGSATRVMDDVSEGIISLAIRRDVELLYVEDPELGRAGNIAALLRFRAEVARAARLSA